jgi:bifunctional non-homologous end joining protein LigD
MAKRTKRATRTTDGLEEYRAKRDFGATPEPAPAAAAEGGGRFVVQEHSATRLHWDLRLEHDGVAASWAVPNGIPDVPGKVRLAVHTEDHPIEYIDWEGVIPKGQYGAGTMRIWDKGTYDLHEWTGDKVTVTFHGERLTGRYHLFQTGRGDKDWLIRRVDPPADPDREPMPAHVAPLVAVPGPLPAADADHAYEIQWEGMRTIAFCEPGRVRLTDVAASDISELFPDVRRMTRNIGAHSAVLDGELVALGRDGRPDRRRLERRMEPGVDSTVRRRARDVPVVYEISDLLYLDGRSAVALPWRERRERLLGLELAGDSWRVSQHHQGDGAALLEAARANGLPGIVAKPLDSRYVPGAGWVAVPADERELRAKLTSPDRVMYRATGFTKADVAAYYEAVAPVLLPHVIGRQLEHGPIACLDDLIAWVSRGRLELHESLAFAGDPERPAAVIFDVVGADAAEGALLLRGTFDQLGLESVAKSSGSASLHVVVPLNSDVTYEKTRRFARRVADGLSDRWAGSAEIGWSANERDQATVSPYSLLAGERPAVSTPVTWDEVQSGELDHEPSAVVARIAAHGDLFAPVLTLVQALPR